MRVRKEVDFADPVLCHLLKKPETTIWRTGIPCDEGLSTTQRRKLGPPEKGWFFPKDFSDKERFPRGKRLMSERKVYRVREKYGPTGYNILEINPFPKEKGEGMKIAVRIRTDEKTFLRLWLQAIRQGVGKEFMNSHYYLRSPHGLELSRQFAEDMGFPLGARSSVIGLKSEAETRSPGNFSLHEQIIYGVPTLFLKYWEADKDAISSFKASLVGEGKAFTSMDEYASFLKAMASYLDYASYPDDNHRKGDFLIHYAMLSDHHYTEGFFEGTRNGGKPGQKQ